MIKLIRIFSFIGLMAMTAVLIYGFIDGNFFIDGKKLFQNPWGVVSFIDLYVGFMLFSIWIIYRETKIYMTITWIFFMMTLGFFTASLYIFYQSFKVDNIKQLLLGKHA